MNTRFYKGLLSGADMVLFRNIFLFLVVVLPLQAVALDNDKKVAIITGSSSGLGYELTKLAMVENMRVVLVDVNPAPSEAIAAKYRQQGGQALVLEVDLAKPALRSDIVEKALAAYGRVDYLFNNAGYAYLASLADHDMAEARRLFEVNYWAYIDLAQQVLPVMQKQNSGVIVNIGSILGFIPSGLEHGVYAATKHALVGFFQATAAELKDSNVKIKIVFPAGMKTNIYRNAVGKNVEKVRNRADDWESPSIVAGEIFQQLHNGELLQFPSVAKDIRRRYIEALKP